ncbi:hypothetical protein, partial [Klebsiella pneumoniae]|uniref:hypothetical protein n=1 Tax=Klebsiella pneumoniae TaxID=573 RepID=UPI0025A26CA4
GKVDVDPRRLADSPEPLLEVHLVQAELQELREGPEARALREILDRTAAEARRRGQELANEDPVAAWKDLSLAFFATTDARVRADLKPTLDRL